jgi:hypothetical protein
MSHPREHRRMKPVLDAARKLDIATNPAPEAIFEAGSGGFQIWCTPDDHPVGWQDVPMTKGAFSKACSYVGSAHWGWNDAGDRITHIWLSTDAYDLGDHEGQGRYAYHNRPEDLAWAERKIRWLFDQAGVPMLPIVVED